MEALRCYDTATLIVWVIINQYVYVPQHIDYGAVIPIRATIRFKIAAAHVL